MPSNQRIIGRVGGRPVYQVAGGALPERFRGQSAEQLRAALLEIDAELMRLHKNPDGTLRADLSAEEEKRFNQLIDDRNALEPVIAQHDRIQAAVVRGGPAVVRAFGADTGDRPGGAIGEALRGLDELARRDRISSGRAGEVEQELRASEPFAEEFVALSDPHYAHAWRKVIQHGGAEGFLRMTGPERDAMATALQAGELRAAAENTPSAGGYGVPVQIDPSILLTAQGSSNPFLTLARQVPATSSLWRGVSSAGVTWSFDTEAAEVSDDSPTLAQPSVQVHMARGFIPYSIEVGQDYPTFAEEMQTLLAAGYDELLADKFARGSGTGEPQGVLTVLSANTNVRVKITTSGQLGLIDLHALWAALPERYRSRAAWVSSASVENSVRALGAAVGASYSVTLTQEGPERLMGAPYRNSAYFADATTGTSNYIWAVVGDWSNFVIARRSGLRLEPVQLLFGTNHRPTGQRGVFGWARIGSASVNDLGFRALTNVT